MPSKIVLYGACSSPFFYRELVRHDLGQKTGTQWRPIIRTWRHFALYQDLLPAEHIFDVNAAVNRHITQNKNTIDDLATYSGSMARDINADRKFPGQIRTHSKEYQLRNAICFYQVYREYLRKEKPDFILFPTVETHDGLILLAVARELGIPVSFTVWARNLSISFFAQDPNEQLPAYVFREPVNQDLLVKAKEIVRKFCENPFKALDLSKNPKDEDLIPFRKLSSIRSRLTRLPIALWNLYQDIRREPHSGRANPLWQQSVAQLWWLWKILRPIKGRLRKHFYDIDTIAQLPKRFIYYPLHFFPEMTISTMAPYFEDQLRAIDLLRFNMPSNYMLVVKEHPAMTGRRPVAFYKEFKHRAGVILADHSMSSIELIKRAALTASITGTAVFEALLLGKPSFMFGKAFFSPWISNYDSFPNLDKALREAMEISPDIIREKAIDCVAKVLSAGYDFVFFDPHDLDVDSKYTMNYQNLSNFSLALTDHLRRLHDMPV